MPRKTELEEFCLWGPHQAHFTDGEREALRGEAFLAPSANKKLRQQQTDTAGSFSRLSRLMPHIPSRNHPPFTGPHGVHLQQDVSSPFPLYPQTLAEQVRRGP